VNRDYTADRDLHRRLDASVRRDRELEAENVEQVAVLRQYAKTHPDNSGCVAGASVLLLGIVGMATLIVEVIA